MSAIAKFMICTKAWIIERPSQTLNIKVKEGDILTIERADFESNIVDVHFGGVLRSSVRLTNLLAHTRVADPSEFQKTLKHCQRCDKIELQPGNWVPKPPCFTPRAGVTIVAETCPACDK